jgi:hypothetical protein
MSLLTDLVPLRRDIDDAVDEAEASPIQKKPGENNAHITSDGNNLTHEDRCNR